MHLLVDAQDGFVSDDIVNKTNGYPLSEVIFLAGIISTIVVETFAHAAPIEDSSSSSVSDIENNDAGMSLKAPKQSVARKVMIALSSIILHSVIVGFDLGLQTSITIVIALLIALIFHQFFEGLSVGMMFKGMQNESVLPKVLSALFVLTTPIGIVIGMTTAPSTAGTVAKGVVNSFAAGSLVYIALMEFVAEELKFLSEAQDPQTRRLMMSAFVSGAAFMALLANWA